MKNLDELSYFKKSMKNYNVIVPNELAYQPINSDDVNILIGENGSGKSMLLSKLAEIYINKNYSKIIAIANSVHDKFVSRNNKFFALRASRGKRQAKETLKKSFQNIATDASKKINYASRALEYVNFDPILGFKVEFIKNSDFEFTIDSLKMSTDSKFEILALIRKFNNHNDKEIIWIEVRDYSFKELVKNSMIDIFKYESILIKLKIIKPIDVFLSKNGTEIPLNDASSGELSLITSIIFISSIIDNNCVVLIDEPENSLHPQWQRDYVKTLLDIFYLYQPRIIIATHSPLIISGAEISNKKVNIFKAKNFEFILQLKESFNVEEIFYEYFEVSTPENRYLSEIIINKLNLLIEKKIDIEIFFEFLNHISKSIEDDRQKNMIDGIKLLSEKIILKP